jgi:hypothetical protein
MKYNLGGKRSPIVKFKQTEARDFQPPVFSSIEPTWAPVPKHEAVLNLPLKGLSSEI